jgi:redox-sensitive bicupin YhaK (pirin superfamily)
MEIRSNPMSIRKISRVLEGKPTIEGAGVHLKRVFGYNEVPLLDPFLLLDDFHSDKPSDYIAGFPWHPHRGIETVTYMLHGKVKHGDSMGNEGVIEPGDVQWMTAGSGIIHEEMPQRSDLLWGLQLWVNLPASHKMMEPRYQEIKRDQIPEFILGKARIRIICGEIAGVRGPVRDIVVEPQYLDVTIPPNQEFELSVKKGHTLFAYIVDGRGWFDTESSATGAEKLIIFGEGDVLRVRADDGVRFLLISGKPIGEPVAWYGPIVMNTQEELDIAFQEYRSGRFIKKK